MDIRGKYVLKIMLVVMKFRITADNLNYERYNPYIHIDKILSEFEREILNNEVREQGGYITPKQLSKFKRLMNP
jgi:hypothetical protein